MSMTYPVIDTADQTSHSVVAITQPGLIQYTIYVEKNCHYASDFVIIGNEKYMKSVNFSKS